MTRLNLGSCALAVPMISVVFLTACGGGSTALPAQPVTSMFANPLAHDGLETIHSFRANPNGLVAYNGLFYGTSVAAGGKNYGNVFSLDASGKEHVLHVFRGGTDPAYPTAGLIVVNGVLYGTTAHGGTGWRHNKQCQTGPPPSGGEGCGTVFSITTSGEVRVLHSFKGGSDGNFPFAGLTLLNGKLYGVTFVGGTRHPCGQYIGTGCGTVFEVSVSGEERIVYRFRGGGKDGAAPEGTLLALDGKLFGTTYSGGDKTCYRSRCGTLFEVTTSGSENALYRFKGGKDGANPQAGLVSAGGALFGTTTGGGAACSGYGCGTIFEATAAGAERVLYRFKGIPDGAYPTSQITEVNGALYGVTPDGGAQCDAPSGADTGTVFELTTTGTEKIVHRFACETYASDGAEPAAPLVRYAQKLYGTTSSGGHYDGGTAFALSL